MRKKRNVTAQNLHKTSQQNSSSEMGKFLFMLILSLVITTGTATKTSSKKIPKSYSQKIDNQKPEEDNTTVKYEVTTSSSSLQGRFKISPSLSLSSASVSPSPLLSFSETSKRPATSTEATTTAIVQERNEPISVIEKLGKFSFTTDARTITFSPAPTELPLEEVTRRQRLHSNNNKPEQQPHSLISTTLSSSLRSPISSTSSSPLPLLVLRSSTTLPSSISSSASSSASSPESSGDSILVLPTLEAPVAISSNLLSLRRVTPPPNSRIFNLGYKLNTSFKHQTDSKHEKALLDDDVKNESTKTQNVKLSPTLPSFSYSSTRQLPFYRKLNQIEGLKIGEQEEQQHTTQSNIIISSNNHPFELISSSTQITENNSAQEDENSKNYKSIKQGYASGVTTNVAITTLDITSTGNNILEEFIKDNANNDNTTIYAIVSHTDSITALTSDSLTSTEVTSGNVINGHANSGGKTKTNLDSDNNYWKDSSNNRTTELKIGLFNVSGNTEHHLTASRNKNTLNNRKFSDFKENKHNIISNSTKNFTVVNNNNNNNNNNINTVTVDSVHVINENTTTAAGAIELKLNTTLWPVKHASVVEGDVILGGLMMVHSREDSITCGPIMPQGGIQALEAMLYTLDRINDIQLLPNISLGAHILDDCDKDTYGLEMAVDFIKGKHFTHS